ncbi:terminase small subunit [Pseudomonas sp. BN415]|uniref:terminase small subunit n=1 Tax=Pseudomonas sp. BN415 TaxID=2567889 RepID=UPI002456454B|nr:terminase small subunit [Pseudomonas sp. BN415]MDH4581387.1 terminase small subunit [Pseudomonas sp. BN415]
MALTAKQQRFVDEYLIDLNATQAAIRAKYSKNTANEQGARLLANVSVQAAIAERMKAREKRTEITQDMVLREYARIAFFDPRNLFNDDGTPKPITELDDDTAAALAGLDLQEVYEGYGDERVFIGYTKKYKVADKKGALDSVARHLGMFTAKGHAELDIELKRLEIEKRRVEIEQMKKGGGSDTADLLRRLIDGLPN